MAIVIYREIEVEDDSLKEIQVEQLNQFEGADICHLQVLKSAAGYYIGCLSKADWTKDDEIFYEPNFRDSKYYFEFRVQAENALRFMNYPVKF